MAGGAGNDTVKVTSNKAALQRLDVWGDDPNDGGSGNDRVELYGTFVGTIVAHGGGGTDVLKKRTISGGSLTWDGFEGYE